MKLSELEKEQLIKLKEFNDNNEWFQNISLNTMLHFLAEQTGWDDIHYLVSPNLDKKDFVSEIQNKIINNRRF